MYTLQNPECFGTFVSRSFDHRLMPDVSPASDSSRFQGASVDEPLLSEYDRVKNIDLKNPVIAGVLTWLVPGLGHYYQGRTAKAVLFFLCIVPTFLVGCLLGSSSETGAARNVYYSWRYSDRRLFFIPQACLGMATIPAGLQAMAVNAGSAPPLGRFMAPPQLEVGDRSGVAPTLAEIALHLHFLFELGTYLTVMAGLMNLLAIFDAIDGPLVYRHEEKDEEEDEEKDPPHGA